MRFPFHDYDFLYPTAVDNNYLYYNGTAYAYWDEYFDTFVVYEEFNDYWSDGSAQTIWDLFDEIPGGWIQAKYYDY